MDEGKILKDFNELQDAKRTGATLARMVVIFAGVCVLGSFVFAYCVSRSAYNKILVIDKSTGEYVKTSAEDMKRLFITRIKSTCDDLVKYANSFDRLTIKNNQAKAVMLCDKTHLQSVFTLYDQEQSYHEALERGVIYSCELEGFEKIGDTKPYEVVFTSILTITDGPKQTKFRILSEGTLIETTAQYPEIKPAFISRPINKLCNHFNRYE